MNDLSKKILTEKIFFIALCFGLFMAIYSQWHQYRYPEKYSPQSNEEDYWYSQGEASQEYYNR